jgi:hypothetical protein
VTVNDNQNPTITCPANQTRNSDPDVCTYTAIGTEFDPTVYSDNCSGSTVSYALTGATTGTGSTSLAGVIFNQGITAVTWTVTDVSGNTATCSFNVTVNAETATITLTSASGTDAQLVCINTAIIDITYSIGGGGTGAGVTGLPSGVNGVYNAGVFTISGTPTVPGTFNYTVTTTGTCFPASASGTITVHQKSADPSSASPIINLHWSKQHADAQRRGRRDIRSDQMVYCFMWRHSCRYWQ